MAKDPESRSADANTVDPVKPLEDRAALVEWLYAQANAARWELSRADFAVALERSASKRLASGALTPPKLEEYLGALHLEDLALATACAAGGEAAWEHFFTKYRAYLRAAAAAILRCHAGSAEACDLADSLFSELYGLAGGKDAQRSLFRYFHGRSSLKTWLRAVLAQRHIDSIRASRRFTDIDGVDGHATLSASPSATRTHLSTNAGPLQDPHRADLVALFRRTLEVALALLDARDRERLRLYYAAEETLAAIGRKLDEHESSVSRNLERTRRELRHHVEGALRKGSTSVYQPATSVSLSEEQIALCFEYAAEDAPIDLDKLLPDRRAAVPKRDSRKP